MPKYGIKPGQKVNVNAMRSDAAEKQASWHSPKFQADKMRSDANKHQQYRGNLPMTGGPNSDTQKGE